MSDVKIGTIPCLSAGECIKTLSFMYKNVINKELEVKNTPSVMMWGPPGVGKSQSVKELARILERETYRRVVVTDVRLLLFNPIDLRGIPTANEDKTLAVWLKPKIFQMDPSYNVINILFLDEITAAPQSVQAAAYQITLDRTVGEHKLPDNCIVIAAGNRTTDKSVAYAMPKALANRLLHIEVEPNFASWNKWAVEHGINSKVLGFLKFKPNYLIETELKTSTLAYATPRTWEMVSDVLNNVSPNIEDVYHLVAGLVGIGIAVEFRSWCSIYSDLPNIDDIFRGRFVDVPKRPDVTYALISSILTYAKAHKDDLIMIENSINYAMRLSPEFSTILLKDYLYIEKDYQKKLLRIPAFSRWLSSKGKLLDEFN